MFTWYICFNEVQRNQWVLYRSWLYVMNSPTWASYNLWFKMEDKMCSDLLLLRAIRACIKDEVMWLASQKTSLQVLNRNQFPVSINHSACVNSFKSSMKAFVFWKIFSLVPLPWDIVGGGGVYTLTLGNIHLRPVWVRSSKYPLLLLLNATEFGNAELKSMLCSFGYAVSTNSLHRVSDYFLDWNIQVNRVLGMQV